MIVKSLEERLKEREVEYKKHVELEHIIQPYIDELIRILPESSSLSISLYTTSSYFHVSVESVEEFEKDCISLISDSFDITWQREIERDEIQHSADLLLDEDKFPVYLIVRSKPTDNCRITKVPTGKTRQASKVVYVEEEVFDYVVECNDD